MREAELEARLRAMATVNGWMAYKFTSPGRPGVPDRLCVGPGGGHFFVELKTAGGMVSPDQTREIARLRALGHRVFVVRTWEEICELPW